MKPLVDLINSHEAAFSGELALAYYDFESNSSFLHNATKRMRSASLIKLPLLFQTLTEVAKGKLELDQRMLFSASDRVGGAGILHTLDAGLKLTLKDVLTLMMIVSDNSATNMIIDLLGEVKINAFVRDLGLQETQLIGKLQLAPEKQNEKQKAGLSNSTCAADSLGLLIRLEQGDLLPEALTALARGILKEQQFTEALARYLPTDKDLHEDVIQVASKSGCLRGLWHDAAIVYNKEGKALYSLVIMTDGSEDKSYSWEQEGMLLIAKLSKAIFDLRSSSLV